MDSVGIGELPDASAYGDQGSNTVGNIAKQIPLRLPALRSLGFDRLVRLDPEETAENAEHAETSFERVSSANSAMTSGAKPFGNVGNARSSTMPIISQ